LLGAFSTNSASASARWQWARTWSVDAGAGYTIFKNVSPETLSSGQGGHSVSGTLSVGHPFKERFRAEAGYQRLHQTYNSIAAISGDPDSDRAFISISYQLTRPLGR
jgi:outer membrane protein assembly factor BamA